MVALQGRSLSRAAGAGPLLRAEALTKRFGATVALDSLDLEIAPGEFFALLGGSGSGKSTLLRLIAGFEEPDGGRLLLEGRDLAGVPPWARPVNMMFQSYALFPHLSVFDNVAYGLRRAGTARAERARRVEQALAMVHLSGLERRKPHQLSGGQRQRVALARSLVMRPRLLLLDEPLGALDAALREATGFELREVQRQTGAAFIMVTHDQQEAMALADRIAVLDRGRLLQVGPPAEVYARPATRTVAAFLGAANILEGRGAADGTVDCPRLRATLCPAALVGDGAILSFALRPERIGLAPGPAPEVPNAVAGVVQEVAFRGDSAVCLVAAGEEMLRVTVPAVGMELPERGTPVSLSWPPDALVPLAG